MKELYKWAKPFLPAFIQYYAFDLRNKDANRTGKDDLAADILEACAPLVTGDFGDGPATLKAARKIEETARAYRVAANDPTLNS